MRTEIQRANAQLPIERARTFATMSEDERRRVATEAAHLRDADTLCELLEAHLTLHGGAGGRVSANTLRTYRRGARDLIQAWQHENLLRPSRDAGALWLRELEAGGKKAATVRSKLAAARALYRALRWTGATTATPFADAKPGRDLTPAWAKREPYTADDLERLRAIAEPEDEAFLLLGAHAGLRVSEILALTWEDVDLFGRTLTVRHGKGGKQRRVVLSRSLHEALAKIGPGNHTVLALHDQPAASRRMQRLCYQAGVKPRGVHALRHSAGTFLRAAGADIADIADHLGHASLDTARGYAKADPTRLRRFIDAW